MTDLGAERRLFHIAVFLAAFVPISAGAAGIWDPQLVGGHQLLTANFDSHFRYMSGLLLGLGIAFLWTAWKIETRSAQFQLLGWIVIAGGLGRLFGMASLGLPEMAHRLALGMELGVVPLLMVWLSRIMRRSSSSA